MITQNDVIKTKLIQDEENVARNFSSTVSKLKVETDLMLEICAYLFSGNADQDHINEITAKFQEQVPILFTDIIPKLQAIESCGSAENGATNLASMISTYGLNPSTFTDRYK